jgi:hypothetical protein
MNNINAVTLPGQTNLSDEIRGILKRTAAINGGLASFMRKIGIGYRRAWEQANRSQGVLVDILPALTMAGIDEPLRIVADACGCDIQPKIKFLRTSNPPRPVRSYGLELHHVTSRITMLLEEALADQRIDEKEIKALQSRVHGARKTLAEFEAKITGILP